MYLYDAANNLVDAEFSIDTFNGFPCFVVESSGGEDKKRGTNRRNPDYNELVRLLLSRIRKTGAKLQAIYLDSKPVQKRPYDKRVVDLDLSYPIDLTHLDVESIRTQIGNRVSKMYQKEDAKKGGNAQKRIRICLDRFIDLGTLLTDAFNNDLEAKVDSGTTTLTETERDYVSRSRIGQQKFRNGVIKRFDGACPLTGITNTDLLLASHIKPWNVCNNKERLDPKNGLLLSPLFDRLFDKGLITFSEQGLLVISPVLSEADRSSCSLSGMERLSQHQSSQKYLVYHRDVIFRVEDG